MTNPTLLGTSGHGAGTSYGAGTYYNNVGLGRCPMYGQKFMTESYASQTIRVPGTISYLSWRLDATFGTGLTLTLNVNSASSTLAVTIPNAVTGWVTDSTDSVTVSSGDQLDFAANVEPASPPYTHNFYCISARFDASTASAQLLATVGSTLISPSSTPVFVSFLGISGQNDATESDQQVKCLAAGTWQHMACNVEDNHVSEDTQIYNRINGNDGSMIITIPAGNSGYFEAPNADSDSVSYGDLLDYEISTSSAASGQFTMYWIGAHFFATESNQCIIGGTPYTGNDIVHAGDTVSSSLFGGGNFYAGDTPRATGLIPYALSASSFTNYIIAVADDTSAATFTLLKNGSASALAVSSGAGQTGFFTTSNSDSVDFARDDTCANQIVGAPGDLGASITWAGAAVLLTS